MGARVLRAAVMIGLAGMTGSAIFHSWKQAMLPDFRVNAASPAAAVLPPAPAAATIDWSLLRELDPRSGAASPALLRRNGGNVRIPGFATPLEDNRDEVSEFLLVPYMGACIHTPPPPPNQIVLVRTANGDPVRISPMAPIWVTGELRIETLGHAFGAASYQLRATGVEPYRE